MPLPARSGQVVTEGDDMSTEVDTREPMTVIEMREMAERAIELLPKDPDVIAEFLFLTGIRGVPYSCCSCPISVYVARMLCGGAKAFPPGAAVVAGFGRLSIFLEADYVHAESGYSAFATPAHVRRFMERFDNSQYPQLLAGVVTA